MPPSVAQGGMRKPGPGRDVLLHNNPDFEIPGMRGPGRVGPPGGMRGVGDRGMMGMHPIGGGGGMMQQSAIPGNGLTGVGRYPPP